METIDLSDKESYAEGSYSKYYRLSGGRGVKAYISNNIRRVRTEFAVMQTLYKANLAPKPFEIVRLKVLNRLCYGILMEHIDGDPWTLGDRNEYHVKRLKKRVAQYVRVTSDDFHSANVFKRRNRLVIVDFGWMYPK